MTIAVLIDSTAHIGCTISKVGQIAKQSMCTLWGKYDLTAAILENGRQWPPYWNFQVAKWNFQIVDPM
jgi:hypothetical protein